MCIFNLITVIQVASVPGQKLLYISADEYTRVVIEADVVNNGVQRCVGEL